MAHVQTASRQIGILKIAILVAVAIGLYVARDICIPFALAILLSFLLAPVVSRLQKWGIGRVPGVLIVVLLLVVAVGSAGWLMLGQFMQLADKLPQYQATVHQKLQNLHARPGSTFDRLNTTFESYASEVESIATTTGTQPAATGASTQETTAIEVKLAKPRTSGFEILRTVALRTLGPVAETGLVLVLTLFMLIQREDVRDRMLRLIGRGQLSVSTKAIDDAASRVSRYLLMQLLVNVTFGVCTTVGLYFIGVPNAPLWGILVACLRFMPYFGVPAAAIPPMLLAFLSGPGFMGVLLTLALFVSLEILIAYFVEPWLYGSGTGISPLAILGSAIFWGWIWGPMGLLLSTPLTVCLAAVGRHVPSMRFLSIILGDEPALPPYVRLYQRLLAGDPDEATEIAEQCLKEKSTAEVYDALLLPALAIAEQDRHRGELTQEQQELVYHYTREITEDFEDRSPQEIAPSGVTVVCVPAHDEADEIAAHVLAGPLRRGGDTVTVLSVQSLASEYVKIIGDMQPDVVCISAIPPQALLHTRYLAKLLRVAYPEIKIVAGMWSAREEKNIIDSRLPQTLVDQVVTTVNTAIAAVTSLGQLHSSRTWKAPQRAAVS